MSSRTYVYCEDQNLGGPNSQAASSNKLIFSSGPYLPYSSTSGPLTAQPINLPTETSTNPSPKSHLPSHLSKNNESKVKNQFIHKHIHKSQKNLNLKNSKSERERIGQQNPILSSISLILILILSQIFQSNSSDPETPLVQSSEPKKKWSPFRIWPRWPPTSAMACSSLSVSSVTSSEKSSIGVALAIFRFLSLSLSLSLNRVRIWFISFFVSKMLNFDFCFCFFVFRDTRRSVWDSKISTLVVSIFVFRLGIVSFQ